MNARAEALPVSRDLRFDSLRGLLLVCMTINHLPTELRMVTDQSLGVFSSAEGFVFLSGLLAGYVYIRRFWKGGVPALRSAAIERSWSIYGWHLASFVGCWAAVIGIERVFGFCSRSAPQLFYSHPLLALGLGSSLLYQPGLLDLLPMYFVFVMLLPLILPALEAGKRYTVLGLSAAVWLVAQASPAIDGAPLYPVHLGTFNLLAWQFLFVAGVVIGHSRSRTPEIETPSVSPWLLTLATAVAVYGFGVRHYQWSHPWPDATFGVYLNKPALGLFRLADFGAVAYLVAVLGSRLPRILTWKALAYLGQASIAVVAAQSVAVTIVLQFDPLSQTPASRTLVVAAVIAWMYLVALAYHRHRARRRSGSLIALHSRLESRPSLHRAA